MRNAIFAVGIGLGLAGCGDPLASLQKIDEVDLSQTQGSAAALPSEAEVAREGFVGTDAAKPDAAVEAAVAQAVSSQAPVSEADVAPSEVALVETPAPKKGGLLGLLRRAVPQAAPAEETPSALTTAVAASQADLPDPAAALPDPNAAPQTQTAALAPVPEAPAVADPKPKRRGLLGRLNNPAADAPRTGPDARDVPYGTILPFGVVARVCDAKGKSLGKRVEKAAAKGFALHDSSVGSAGARTWYVTGFSDGCPRQLTGANVLIGGATLYEQLHFGPGGDNLPYGETDKAYEGVKRKVCGTRKGKPCGGKIDRMEKTTFFVSAYERFGNSSRWSELLIHDGEVLAAAIKPN